MAFDLKLHFGNESQKMDYYFGIKIQVALNHFNYTQYCKQMENFPKL